MIRPLDRHKNTAKRREQKRKSAPMTVNRMEKFVQQELREQRNGEKRPPGRPKGSRAFDRVTRARELLAESSTVAARLVVKAAKVAAEKGDSAPAEFLLKHTGTQDEKGKVIRPLLTNVDRMENEDRRMPTIQIGWLTPAAPSVNVIDVEPVAALPEHRDS